MVAACREIAAAAAVVFVEAEVHYFAGAVVVVEVVFVDTAVFGTVIEADDVDGGDSGIVIVLVYRLKISFSSPCPYYRQNGRAVRSWAVADKTWLRAPSLVGVISSRLVFF